MSGQVVLPGNMRKHMAALFGEEASHKVCVKWLGRGVRQHRGVQGVQGLCVRELDGIGEKGNNYPKITELGPPKTTTRK